MDFYFLRSQLNKAYKLDRKSTLPQQSALGGAPQFIAFGLPSFGNNPIRMTNKENIEEESPLRQENDMPKKKKALPDIKVLPKPGVINNPKKQKQLDKRLVYNNFTVA